MPAGYSGTPLAKKLGIKPGMRVCLKGAPPGYEAQLAGLPDDVVPSRRLAARADVVQLFTRRRDELARLLPDLLERIRPDGAVWVSWPKKASGVATDVTEDVVRAVALPLGLVDVKVCAVDDVWSALRLVIRKELR